MSKNCKQSPHCLIKGKIAGFINPPTRTALE